nr:uncharacterized protein LOC113812930 [Penaeus vannamei]
MRRKRQVRENSLIMFSILLVAFVVAALGKEKGGIRVAFLAMAPTIKSNDMKATFHLMSADNTSCSFEFKFLFSDGVVKVSVLMNERRKLPSLELKIKNLLFEIVQLKPNGFLLSLDYPYGLLSRKDVFVETETEMNSISGTSWKFEKLGSGHGEWVKVMAVSVAGEAISLKIGSDDERTLNTTQPTKVSGSFEIKESLQGEGASKSNSCASFHFRNDGVCDFRKSDVCEALYEIFPKNDEIRPKDGFWRQNWHCLLILLFFAYLCFKGYCKSCVPCSSCHRTSSPKSEGTHSIPSQPSFTSHQNTNLARPQVSLPRSDATSRESINSEYFRMSDLAKSPETPAAGDCRNDGDYSRLQHITAVPILEGHYDCV